jgi:hypothetical protein
LKKGSYYGSSRIGYEAVLRVAGRPEEKDSDGLPGRTEY